MSEHPPDLPCQRFVELVTDYLEGVLPPDLVARIDAHLADCPYCADYLDQIRTTIALVGQVGDDELSAAAWQQLRAAFRAG